ncbi:hypothetical protein HO173_002526 [Letharia columbiana]|uniref:Zn(2)-C6 fungal-type domain-containing protein n=1 Tax=Letharia columbiana TaxID=112416 RepID=A0A8H6G2C0_9LECA|nr:uncharacterized protein HO173_002526 [Letharia columbiana]KAF6239265.1 hypothetical protein HO173_002526 [Letharia columbiana]
MDTTKPHTKYRASCDGCYLAKLKCTKERPICPRCKKLGLTCTYSPSQRTGKRRAPKSQASSSGSTTTTTTPTSPAPSSSGVLEWQPAASSQASTMVPTETLALPFEKAFFAPNNDPQQSPMDATMSNWPSPANALQDFDSDLLAPWRGCLPSSEKDDPLFETSDDFVDDFISMTALPSHQQSFNATNGALSHILQTCNCFDSITQILQKVHNQSRRSSNPNLEATLSCSKEVTARGEALLNCTCTEDSTLVMLFAALVAKYLSLYAAHIDLTSSSWTFLADISAASSRVTIGGYTMDAEDEERLRIEIVLMELQKLNTLLMKFQGKFSSSEMGYESHTYETMVAFLNMRLREAMDKLQRQKQRYQPPS